MRKYLLEIDLSTRPHENWKYGYFVLPPISSKFGAWLFKTFFDIKVLDKSYLDTKELSQAGVATITDTNGAIVVLDTPRGKVIQEELGSKSIKKGYDKY